MLRDDKERSDVFSQSVLMDRWVSGSDEKSQGRKCRSIRPEVASKHLHLTEFHSKEDIFRRRLFVHNVRKNFQAHSVRNERRNWMR